MFGSQEDTFEDQLLVGHAGVVDPLVGRGVVEDLLVVLCGLWSPLRRSGLLVTGWVLLSCVLDGEEEGGSEGVLVGSGKDLVADLDDGLRGVQADELGGDVLRAAAVVTGLEQVLQRDWRKMV